MSNSQPEFVRLALVPACLQTDTCKPLSSRLLAARGAIGFLILNQNSPTILLDACQRIDMGVSIRTNERRTFSQVLWRAYNCISPPPTPYPPTTEEIRSQSS